MVTQDLVTYIENQLAVRQTQTAIQSMLLQKGWVQEDIDAAFAQITAKEPKQSHSNIMQDLKTNHRLLTIVSTFFLILVAVSCVKWLPYLLGATATPSHLSNAFISIAILLLVIAIYLPLSSFLATSKLFFRTAIGTAVCGVLLTGLSYIFWLFVGALFFSVFLFFQLIVILFILLSVFFFLLDKIQELRKNIPNNEISIKKLKTQSYILYVSSVFVLVALFIYPLINFYVLNTTSYNNTQEKAYTNIDIALLFSKIFGTGSIRHIIISQCHLGAVGGISQLPPSIGNLKGLNSLVLCGNDMQTLPPEIGKLTNLEVLNISGNLKKLPPQIGDLTNLKELTLSGEFCKIAVLPDQFGNLVNLEVLTIDCPLRSLPLSLVNLKKLKTLSLNGTYIYHLPSLLGNLNSLEDLNITNATQLPPGIGKLQNLKHLQLSGGMDPLHQGYALMPIANLPLEIGDLKNLEKLEISYENVGALPVTIGNLEKLTYVDLTVTNVTDIPQTIGNLKHLTYLRISNNPPLAQSTQDMIRQLLPHTTLGF